MIVLILVDHLIVLAGRFGFLALRSEVVALPHLGCVTGCG